MDPTSELHPPKDLSYHFSRSTRARPKSSIKNFYKYFQIPGIGQLAGGLPNASYFPYDTLEARTALPDRFKPTPVKPVDPPTQGTAGIRATSAANPPSSRIVVPHGEEPKFPLTKIDLTTALQYGTAQGYPPLYNHIRDFTRNVLHPNVPYAGGPEIVLTVGSTDGFSKAIQAFNNEWSEDKDWIRDKEGLLCEEYAYMNAIQAARPRGMNIVPVKIDDEGMLPTGKGGLEDVLANWDSTKGKRPHLMYTVTMGQNPTGSVLSLSRKKQIYALCSKYDVIIIEDDPYWFLQYPSAVSANMASGRMASSPLPQAADIAAATPGKKISGYPFIDSLVPSYLQVDTDGRVVRLDTFSKTIAPGCRMGWITAQPAFIERILRITETSTQQPSGFVQSMVAELLMGPQTAQDPGVGGGKDGKGWNVGGWVRWLEGLRGNYERRMNIMCSALEAHKYIVQDNRRRLPSKLEDNWVVVQKQPIYDFAWPVGGMFLWLKINAETHPLADAFDGPTLAHALFLFLISKPYLVLIASGALFSPTPEIAQADGWKYFRACFAACDDDKIEGLSKNLAEGFAAFWRIEDKKVIEKLIRDDEEDGEGSGDAMLDVVPMVGPC